MLMAVDSSTRVVGVSLYDGVQVVSELVWTSENFHTVELAPAVNQLLSKANIKISDLQVLQWQLVLVHILVFELD